MLKNTNTRSLSPGCLMFRKYTAHVKFMLTGLVWDAVHWGRAKDGSAEREMRSQLGRRGEIPNTNMESQKNLGLLINGVLSHQVNSGTKWRVWLAPPRPALAYKHTQAFPFILSVSPILPCILSVQTNSSAPETRGKDLRVDAEHDNVLPQIPRPNHFNDARLFGLLLKSSLEFCKQANRLWSHLGQRVVRKVMQAVTQIIQEHKENIYLFCFLMENKLEDTSWTLVMLTKPH